MVSEIASEINNTLYDAFGQRQVSVIYAAQNQYHVVMEAAPQYWQNPETLRDIYISTSGGTVSGTKATNALAGTVSAIAAGNNAAGTNANNAATTTANDAATATAHIAATTTANNAASTTLNNAVNGAVARQSASAVAADTARNQANNALANTGRGATSTGSPVSTTAETMVPLSTVAHFGPGNTALAVNHQSLFVAATISFNLAPGVSLGLAQQRIEAANRLS